MTTEEFVSVIVPVHESCWDGQSAIAEMSRGTDVYETLPQHVRDEVNEVARDIFNRHGINPDEHRLYVKVLQNARINGQWLEDRNFVAIRYSLKDAPGSRDCA